MAGLWRHGFQSVWRVSRGVARVYIHAVEAFGVRGTGFICEYMDLIRFAATGLPCLPAASSAGQAWPLKGVDTYTCRVGPGK
jgi:hypothetical protein